MHEHPLRSIFAKLVRAAGPGIDVEVCYIHRGAPNNQVTVKISTISRMGKGWFCLPDGDTQIPYHRVIWVKDIASGKTFWEKRYPHLTSSRHH